MFDLQSFMITQLEYGKYILFEFNLVARGNFEIFKKVRLKSLRADSIICNFLDSISCHHLLLIEINMVQILVPSVDSIAALCTIDNWAFIMLIDFKK